MHGKHADLPAAVLNEASEVIRELAAAGIQVPESQLLTFARYLHRIQEWGRRINLVATWAPRRYLSRLQCPHFLDSSPGLLRTLEAAPGSGFFAISPPP
jgi:16S rRNA G527 N7-methylase RsmG